MKERVIGKVPILLGFASEQREIRNGQVHLRLRGMDGSTRELLTEHVISATGYKVDIRRLKFPQSGNPPRKIHTVEIRPYSHRPWNHPFRGFIYGPSIR